MAKKIPFHVVVQKIQSGKITENDLRRYFVVERNPKRPFDFHARINLEHVDVTNVENSGTLADPLLKDAATSLEVKRLGARRRTTGFQRQSPIIAEGDSWFKLPDLHPIVPWTLINFLQQQYSIINLAYWGDTFADMIQQGEFWSYLESGQADVFLFSAGGNDILGGGELWQYLNIFDVDHAKASDAAYYIKQEFYDNLAIIVGEYESLIQQVKARAPHVIMVGHGYDYAIPRIDGPWLGSPMIRQGLYPDARPDLCQAIVRVMIDAFNVKLNHLQQNYANYQYVNLRGTIKPDEWWDELHPMDKGARRTAAKFAGVLEKLPTSGAAQSLMTTRRSRLLRAA